MEGACRDVPVCDLRCMGPCSAVGMREGRPSSDTQTARDRAGAYVANPPVPLRLQLHPCFPLRTPTGRRTGARLRDGILHEGGLKGRLQGCRASGEGLGVRSN